jgi:hypothetical protein
MAYFSPVRITTKIVMISIDDFKVASFEKKCDLVTSHTTYITSRCDDEKKIYLYHSGKFFIEVFYSPLLKRVLLIHAFNDLNNLLLYAESVSLEDLKL